MHSFLEGSAVAAFAHRGGALEGAENTLEAFQHAVDLGYRYIETDVQVTADGVVVIFHDDILDRVTDLKGQVSERTWDEISHAKVHGKGGIPRLEDALRAWPEVRFNIDAKTDQVAAPLCRIARADRLERLCLASDSDKRIAFIREELGAAVCTAGATWETAAFLIPILAGLKPRPTAAHCFQVPPKAYGIPAASPRQLSRAQEEGKAVHIWTIDEEAEMERLLDLGVQGIMTDRPALLKEVLARRNLWG
jgi:glycerophosphoryl diester phosphodiesterase